MRLKFGASMPPDSTLLVDQWIEFIANAATQNFNIVPYVAQGYDSVDVYCVGGGGSGGGGGGATISQPISSGGGGGGGGAGNVAFALSLTLLSLPTIVPIYVGLQVPGGTLNPSPGRGNPGAAGHSSIFGYGLTTPLLHAYGGGGGGAGGGGTTSPFPGNGGGGGAGSGLTDFGAVGGNASNSVSGLGGVGQEGSGSGGQGGRYYIAPRSLGANGQPNNNQIVDYGDGINYAYRAAGGGGGGHGYAVANTPTGTNLTNAGKGGYGYGLDGSAMVLGHVNGNVSGHGNGRSGSGGGGAGGVNIPLLTGHRTAFVQYGGGGRGGIGQLFPGTKGPATAGTAGLSGICLVRVYKKAS